MIPLVLLSTPILFANSQSHSHDPGEVQEEGESSESIEISVVSGLLTLILLISTVTAGRLMKKGKVAVKTHHRLAYATLVIAIAHGIYNFLSH